MEYEEVLVLTTIECFVCEQCSKQYRLLSGFFVWREKKRERGRCEGNIGVLWKCGKPPTFTMMEFAMGATGSLRAS